MKFVQKLFSLKNFNKSFSAILFMTLISFLLSLGFAVPSILNSPPDYQQSNAVFIMYLHVPSAFLSLLIYSMMAAFNVAGFVWKNPFFHLIAKSIAPIGALFTFATLITGSIWGKPIWGTWWVFDARLTSVLILFFLYLGYIILVDSFDEIEKGEKIAAILSIVGFINIPIIKFSTEYWNTLHQPASIVRSGGNAIHHTMFMPLLLMFVVCFSYFVFFAMIKIKTEILLKQKRSELK
jgi:heme exporter protein C